MINSISCNFNDFKNVTKPKNLNKLSIFYYNDTHGNSDQMAGLLSAAREFNKKALNSDCTSFVLSAGDNSSGADSKKNNFIMNLMQNVMKVVASAVGNHEIDAGVDEFYENAKQKNINYIATNVEFEDEKISEVVKKSMIVEQNGVKYGFVGTMPIDFKTCTKASVQDGIEVMDFEDTIEALQEEIDSLKAEGVNKIILLSHVGYEEDKKLASALDGVDIIVGGHSHSVVEGAKHEENIVKSKSGEPVVITQAGENGKYYGVLTVEFNPDGTIKTIANNLSQTTNRAKSPSVEYIKDKQLGTSPVVCKLSEVESLPANRRIEPCQWTAVMADSMRSELGADVALINSANIRKVPQVGNVTERDIVESAPMKNQLIKTKITQKQLLEAVGSAAKRTFSSQNGEPGLLQGSGFTYKIDKQGNLIEFNIVDKKGKLSPIDIKNPSDKITYSIIYDTFTAQKDGEYPELAPKFEVKTYDFDKDKTMIDYLSKQKNKNDLKIVNDGRLEILDT